MAQLDKLKSDWEGLAERDALWAILTDGSKAGGKWDVADFMATGEAEIQTVMNHLARIGRTPDFNGAALDFGCGVGRLTQALARRFLSAAGIDISQHMIDKANSLNRYPRCHYVTGSGLSLTFADASFSFIYSNIVLQHMPPSFAQSYLQEFVRVLAPGGVLIFGVQDSFQVRDASSLFTRIRQVLRLRTLLNKALRNTPVMQMHCLPERLVQRALGSAKIVDVQFTNTADRDFNGKLIYRASPPASGYISKQYCAVKEG